MFSQTTNVSLLVTLEEKMVDHRSHSDKFSIKDKNQNPSESFDLLMVLERKFCSGCPDI